MSTTEVKSARKPIKYQYVGFPDDFVARFDERVEADYKPLGRWHSRAGIMTVFLQHDIDNYDTMLALMDNKTIEEEFRQKLRELHLIK